MKNEDIIDVLDDITEKIDNNLEIIKGIKDESEGYDVVYEEDKEIYVDNTDLDGVELEWNNFERGLDVGSFYVGLYTSLRSVGMPIESIDNIIGIEAQKEMLKTQYEAEKELTKIQVAKLEMTQI